MAVVEKDIFIVGCGPGSADYLPAISRKMAEESDVLSGSRRLLELFPGCGRDRIVMGSDVEEFLGEMDKLLRNGRRLTVLVSGDPGVFSLATRVIHRFGLERCHVVPAVSSVQVAFARVGLEWAGARIISAHGRKPVASVDELRGEDRIAVLAGTREALQWAAEVAVQLGDGYQVVLCEDLTLPDERVRHVGARELTDGAASSLSIVLLVRKKMRL